MNVGFFKRPDFARLPKVHDVSEIESQMAGEKKEKEIIPEKKEEKNGENKTEKKLEMGNEEKEAMIASAGSFEELYSALQKMEKIDGSGGNSYSSQLLIDTIEKVKKNLVEASKHTDIYEDNEHILEITRSCGLREKCKELFKKEGINIKSRQEQKKESGIKDATSFEELYDAIRKFGPVKGSQETYQPDNLISLIESAVSYANDPANIEKYGKVINSENKYFILITNAEGIRDKVYELLENQGFILERPHDNRVQYKPAISEESIKSRIADFQKDLEGEKAKLAEKEKEKKKSMGMFRKMFGGGFSEEGLVQFNEEVAKIQENVNKIEEKIKNLQSGLNKDHKEANKEVLERVA